MNDPVEPLDDDGAVLLHESSPDGSVQAVVEQDDRTVYLYLHANKPGFGTRACWVRNLVPGPATIDRSEFQQGLAPRLPRLACRHPQGAPPLSADALEIVWFESGDGAALKAGDRWLAAIPPWSGEADFHGYAADCREETELCWPMPNEPEWFERLEAARRWWAAWRTEPRWPRRQAELIETYERQFGKHRRYFAIDGEKWPPRGLVLHGLAETGAASETVLALTVGVSLRPMPKVETQVEQPLRHERIELAAFAAAEAPLGVCERLSSTARFPWHFDTWLGPGHTMELSPNGDRAPSDHEPVGLLWVDAARFPDPIGSLRLPPVDGRPTTLLVAMPLTRSDLVAARAGAGEELAAARLARAAAEGFGRDWHLD